jgi:hypothetical protein
VLNFISAYQAMPIYIRAARQHPQTDWVTLWERHAIEPYWQSWAAGQFNEERTRQQMQNPITDLDALTIEADLLTRSGVEQIIQDALGYHLVQNYLQKHSSLSWVELLDIDPWNIYQDFI